VAAVLTIIQAWRKAGSSRAAVDNIVTYGGVLLTNAEPEKFHVHTLVRTPNGNDYGLDLLRMHYEHAPHHRHG